MPCGKTDSAHLRDIRCTSSNVACDVLLKKLSPEITHRAENALGAHTASRNTIGAWMSLLLRVCARLVSAHAHKARINAPACVMIA